jgi:hypothetical protein
VEEHTTQITPPDDPGGWTPQRVALAASVGLVCAALGLLAGVSLSSTDNGSAGSQPVTLTQTVTVQRTTTTPGGTSVFTTTVTTTQTQTQTRTQTVTVTGPGTTRTVTTTVTETQTQPGSTSPVRGATSGP